MNRLTKAQKEAITHIEGPCMVVAGPGSGKTFTLIQRLLYMTREKEISPESILMITFSRAAAKEMETRYKNEANGKSGITFGTFHSVFYTILRCAYGNNSIQVLTQEERMRLLSKVVRNIYLDWEDSPCDSEEELIEGLLQEIGLAYNTLTPPDKFSSKMVSRQVFEQVVKDYEYEKTKLGKIDFDDMLTKCYDLFTRHKEVLKAWQNKFRYVMVDEFQDINPVQFKIIYLLTKAHENLLVVGDDDQSIYAFRGACPEIMLGFSKVYPNAKQIFLDTNFRSATGIVTTSLQVIAQNENRFLKKIKPANKHLGRVHIQEVSSLTEELNYIEGEIEQKHRQGIPYKEMAILYRTNQYGENMLMHFVRKHIPVKTRDRMPCLFDHFVARDLLAYLRMSQGSRRRQDFFMVMNRPKRYISRQVFTKETMEFDELEEIYQDKGYMMNIIAQMKREIVSLSSLTPSKAIQVIRKQIGYDDFLKEYCAEKGGSLEQFQEIADKVIASADHFSSIADFLSYVEDYQEKWNQMSLQEKRPLDAVTLSTLHSAKGLEFSYVYIMGLIEEEIPYKKAILPKEIEEERRMMYVGMTRAKEELVMVFPHTKNGKVQSPSRFLLDFLPNKRT